MRRSYQKFIQTVLDPNIYDVKGSFVEENGQIYIVAYHILENKEKMPIVKIPFILTDCYKENMYDYLIKAAVRQLHAFLASYYPS